MNRVQSALFWSSFASVLFGTVLLLLNWDEPEISAGLLPVNAIGQVWQTGDETLDKVLRDPSSPLNKARRELTAPVYEASRAEYVLRMKSRDSRFHAGVFALIGGYAVQLALLATRGRRTSPAARLHQKDSLTPGSPPARLPNAP